MKRMRDGTITIPAPQGITDQGLTCTDSALARFTRIHGSRQKEE